MADDNWQKVREIFDSALRHQPDERRRFVNELCGDDKTLLAEVESLLSSHHSAESFMETPAVAKVAHLIEFETETLEAGKRLGHYEIIEQIGAGGMGEVYLAKDTKLDRNVAIKILNAEFSQDEANLQRFVSEAKAASALNHPNILTIYEFGETEDARFIVSEYIEGKTLREIIRASRLRLPAILDIAIQITSALAAAHQAHLVHRDIKPENIMVRPDGYVKVLDFGLAKLVEQKNRSFLSSEEPTVRQNLTAKGVIVGTVNYMSPEQAKGEKVDERTDIFSLGVLVYEMLAGKPPFAGGNAIVTIGSILNKEPEPLSRQTPEVPQELERIINKALRKDREERYQTAKDLLIDLKEVRQHLEFQNQLERSAAPVREETKTQVVNATTSDVASHTTSSAEYLSEFHSHKRAALLTLAIMVIVAGSISFMWYRFRGPDPSKPALPAAKIVPFTSFPGSELHPTFSPDGNQIAFAWTGEKGDNFDLYIKRFDAGSPPLRLTTNPADDLYPAWSPDGHHIAFVRQSGSEMGIFLVPALGGPERKLYSGTSAFFTLFEHGNGLSWSPDGESLGFSGRDSPTEPNSIFLLSVGSLEKRKITSPPMGFLGDSTPAFSPDGKTLAFMRRSSVGTGGHIYVLPMSGSGGEPKPLTIDNSAQISMTTRSLAWTTDSREIVFAQSTSGRLWRVLASGGIPALLEGSVENTVSLAISHQSNRLAFSQAVADTNIWQVELRGAMGKRSNPTNLISSTRTESSPQFSPDGKKIAFASSRAGSSNIWISDSEGLNSIQLTSFPGTDVGSPRWSPDGRQIAFHSAASGNRDIYVLGAEGGKPRLLTEENAEDVRPSWLRDGEWIYFGSNRTGDWQVWKAPAKGGQAIQVTRQGGREAFESLDGKFVYYSKDSSIPGIWRITATGGEEIRILDEGVQGFWALLDVGIYFVNTKARPHPTIEFFNFATGQTTRIAAIEKELELVFPSLSISPDGRKILYVQVDRRESDIMLMENFR